MTKRVYQSFYYSLVDGDNETWAPNAGPDDNLIGIGVNVPAGRTREIPTQIDYDADYELYGITVQAYWWDAINGIYVWYEPQVELNLHARDHEMDIGTPLAASLRLKLAVLSPRKQYIFGELTDDNFQSGNTEFIVPRAISGYENGKIPFMMDSHLLAAGGLIALTIHNTHAVKDLVVSGTYWGRKVRT